MNIKTDIYNQTSFYYDQSEYVKNTLYINLKENIKTTIK